MWQKLKSTGVDQELAHQIMDFLAVADSQLTGVELLDVLVTAYTQHVPWESVSRIVKKSRHQGEKDSVCARWPDEFWRNSMELGTGGTCFESNYAFLALLQALGYDGYLTVNNMDESIGCHSAIIVCIEDRPWLVDAGFPLYVPVPLDPDGSTQRKGIFHEYHVLPNGSDSYIIERSHHPQSYCFTLINRPVPEPTYRQVLSDDYGPQGFFLDRVIINKVVRGHICRFSGGESPFKLERFRSDYTDSRPLGNDPAHEIASYFSLETQLVRQALKATSVSR